jgi:hypothetical protein
VFSKTLLLYIPAAARLLIKSYCKDHDLQITTLYNLPIKFLDIPQAHLETSAYVATLTRSATIFQQHAFESALAVLGITILNEFSIAF